MNTRNLHFVRLGSAALLAAMALGGSAMVLTASADAASTGAMHSAPGHESASGVKYVNGGIGHDSQESMRKDAHNWPLRITFSEQANNEFVADADLSVFDKAGKSVMHLKGAGPLTYLRMQPGEYRITAVHNGKTLTRTVHVGDKGLDVHFHWE